MLEVLVAPIRGIYHGRSARYCLAGHCHRGRRHLSLRVYSSDQISTVLGVVTASDCAIWRDVEVQRLGRC
jgi:hypothetical protein